MQKSVVYCAFVLATVSACGGGNSASGGSGGGESSIGGSSASNGGTTGIIGVMTTGGSMSVAGGAPTGGVAATGGGNAAGGSSVAGGSPAAGGTVTTSSTGGSIPSGGATAVGGSPAGSGGTQSLGGTTSHSTTTAAGGVVAAGGTKATGGVAAGGSTSTSVSTSTGGSTSAGGATACPALPAEPTGTKDAVAGTMLSFNDNGGWCWYQDERAVVNTKANKLIIASTASGGTRSGQNEAVIYDLATNKGTRYTLPSSLPASDVDDHNAPALLIRPDGKYFAQWSSHRADCYTRTSIFDGTSWGAEYKFDWTPLGCPWPSTQATNTNLITYSNPWYIGSSIYTGVRSVGTDNAFLTSTDDGATLSYYGRLMDTKQVGYVAGYYKYWGNNTDRIDFVGTEAHPRDDDNSLWHGYIQGGKVYNSSGTVIDSSLQDSNSTTTNSKDISAYTPVFKTGTSVNGVALCRMWDYDIVRYADGTIAILGQGRANSCTSTPSGSDPDKRMIYSRWDGTSWKTTYLVKAGPKLYADEEDYTGLGALVPDDPSTIYVSTPYDPRDDTTMSTKHELWMGVTCDNGATFKWTPVTKGSSMDNLRPIVPKWDANHRALLWLRGTYTSAQSYNFQIVGTISGQ